jgi:hypothetical protein
MQLRRASPAFGLALLLAANAGDLLVGRGFSPGDAVPLPTGTVAAQERQPAPTGGQVTAISGATVLGAGASPIPNAVVVIQGSRITRVGPAATIAVPSTRR